MHLDSEIVSAVLAGNREAFAQLVERYRSVVYAVGLQITGNHHAAEDAAQEAFITAFEKLASLRRHSSFGAWIIKIARHQALRSARTAAREQCMEEVEAIGCDRDGGLDDDARLLLDTVSRLPQHERDVVMLKHFIGWKIEEIAKMTGRPTGTISKQLSRAYARLKTMLEAHNR